MMSGIGRPAGAIPIGIVIIPGFPDRSPDTGTDTLITPWIRIRYSNDR
jgi:hypothetical protein